MKSKRSMIQWQKILAAAALVLGILACTMPVEIGMKSPTADTGLQETNQALSLQVTLQAAIQGTQQAAMQATLDVLAAEQQAAAEEPTAAPQPTSPPEAPVEPAADVESQMKTAKILVYEDTVAEGFWIKNALDNAGYEMTHVGNATGTFLDYLNSGMTWDLIIVGAESKISALRGEFWDAINDQVDRGAALIIEIWYLESEANGRISKIMNRCGIEYFRDQPLATSIYWLEPTHPVFNQPNMVTQLLHGLVHWNLGAGDLLKVPPGSAATLIAGTQPDTPNSYGQIAVCMDGTVIFQTFSNHDYPKDNILPLWQNYVDYTLRNHFEGKND